MNINTALNHKQRAILAYRDLYSSAKSFKMSHADMIKRGIKIQVSIKHCPQWVKSEVNGYKNCLYDIHTYQGPNGYLEFCYLMPDGQLHSTVKKSKRSYELKYSPREVHEKAISKDFYYIDTNCKF